MRGKPSFIDFGLSMPFETICQFYITGDPTFVGITFYPFLDSEDSIQELIHP